MPTYRLNYSEIHSKSDTPVYKFNKFSDLVNFVFTETRERMGNVVFLIYKDYSSCCPFITDNAFDIEFILEKMPGMGDRSDTFIQECRSFEEAYQLAFKLVETKKLCYTN